MRLDSACRPLAVLLFVALTTGCGPTLKTTQSPSTIPPSPPTGPASTTPGPSTATSSPRASQAFDPSRLRIGLENVVDVPGGPLDVVNAGDGSGRLFVVSQSGQIWVVADGARRQTPFLDVSSEIVSGGEQGLLGLAFHPNYPEDPHFFIDYTDRSGNTVVSRWRVSSDPNVADANSEEIILHVDQPFANHNGGAVRFGPDGDLYISLGDGGSGGDPFGNGQNLDTYLAKILRIDVDHPDDGRAYGIPGDNPFVGRPDAKPEAWVTGLRNPWRISFDRATGDLWIGDVGQGAYEEIDVVRAGSGGGQDFGWNVMEGFHCFPSGDSCDQQSLTPPVAEYSHGGGVCAVTGGYVYRGRDYPALEGGYVFADYCTGEIWVISPDASDVRDPSTLLDSDASISGFGEDEAGELYATDLRGELLRVTATLR
jgi:glucose/arabinose dehydrogenase